MDMLTRSSGPCSTSKSSTPVCSHLPMRVTLNKAGRLASASCSALRSAQSAVVPRHTSLGRVAAVKRTASLIGQQSTSSCIETLRQPHFAFDVVGLGQAMVDVQFTLPDDALLAKLGVESGGRRVITVKERADSMQLLQDSGCSCQVNAGGSLANTLVAVARLSAAGQHQPGAPPPLRICMAGSVGDDPLGQYFTSHMQSAGVTVLTGSPGDDTHFAATSSLAAPRPSYDCSSSNTDDADANDVSSSGSSSSSGQISCSKGIEGSYTGTVMVLTTPSAQRSFLSFFPADDLTPPLPAHVEAAISSARVVVIEGYLWELPGAPAFMAQVVQLARRRGTQVVLTAGDPGVVARHRDEILEVLHMGVDVLFTNAAEAGELVGRPNCDATVTAAELGGLVSVAVVTDGSKGSVITALGELHVVPPHWTPEGPKDTCGAGDAYAAGLLYAVLQGHHLRTAGQFASRTASVVIGRMGPQLHDTDAEQLVSALPRHAHSSILAATVADGVYADVGVTGARRAIAGGGGGKSSLLNNVPPAAVAL